VLSDGVAMSMFLLRCRNRDLLKETLHGRMLWVSMLCLYGTRVEHHLSGSGIGLYIPFMLHENIAR
jgi:hypothetical protein